ncbi:MAG TPA: hypothetical protein V6C86_24665 [Oculatellaceae cyanobacterium]
MMERAGEITDRIRYSKASYRTLIFFWFVIAVTPAVAADRDVSVKIVNELSDQILSKELEIFQHGIELKLYGEKKKLWRDRRWFVYSLANSSLTSVGAFMTGAGRLRYANQPKKAPPNLFENATIIRVTANAVSAGGTLVEFGIDAFDQYKARKQRLDARSEAQRVIQLHREIVDLLGQRQVTTRNLEDASERKVYEVEEHILKDLLVAGLEDFAAYYDESKGRQAKRFARLLLVGTSNIVSGGGSLYSGVILPHQYKDNPVKRVSYGGVGGITDIATGSGNILTPAVATVVDMANRRDSDSALFKELGAAHSDELYDLKKHDQELRVLFKDRGVTVNDQFLIRQKAVDVIFDILAKHEKANADERRVAVRNFMLSILNSGVDASGSFSKVVNGIGTTVGAYRYTRDNRKRFLVTGRAGIVYGIGNAFGVAEVIRDEATAEVKQASRKKRHALLSQQLTDELEQMRTAQSMLTN